MSNRFKVEPRVAMLCFSNFGSVNHPEAKKVADAVEIVHKLRPDIVIDGEIIQAVAAAGTPGGQKGVPSKAKRSTCSTACSCLRAVEM